MGFYRTYKYDKCWQMCVYVCTCACMHVYMRACGANDPKLRDTLSKSLMGMPQQSGRPCKSQLYAYIYIYIYIYICIYMCVCVFVCALQAYTSVNYSILWYKNDNCIGFRRKTGDKKQCMSFRSRTCSEKKMRKVADECLKKLDAGSALDVVKEWAARQVG